MGTLISPEKEIEAIRFVPFPTKVQGATKIIRVGPNLIMARIKDNVCATNRVENFAYLPHHAPWTDRVVTGLYRLGMISKKAMAAHNAIANARRDANDKKWAASAVVDNAKTLGMKLTKSQLSKIEEVTK